MAQPVTSVRIYPTLESMSRAVAVCFQALIARHTGDNGEFSVCLSGGSTPKALYQLLAAEFADTINWRGLRFYWGDERYVSHGDPANNFRLARDTLLDKVNVSSEHVFPMPTHHAELDDAAQEYEATLRREFHAGSPTFDLVLLGVGEDGHTASLFPGSHAIDEERRWVVRTEAPTEPVTRLSLTFPVLNSAACIYVLVSGDAKAKVVRQTLAGPPGDRPLPVERIQPRDGQLVWWMDEAAASLLGQTDGLNIQRFQNG